MKTVSPQAMAGNEGVSRVAAWLTQFSLVRPVAAETDVGIDLYCETLEQGVPFLHFWAQVKTQEPSPLVGEDKGDQKQHRINIIDDGARATYRFDGKDLEYWNRQPIPVFAFLVPDRNGPHYSKLYVVDLTKWFVLHPRTRWGGSVKIASHIMVETTNEECKRVFFEEHVRNANTMIWIREGFHRTKPELAPGYLRTSLYGYQRFYLFEVVHQIRNTASATLTDIARAGWRPTEQCFVDTLSAIMRNFEKPPFTEHHWEDYRALALFEMRQSAWERAEGYFRRAKDCILEDSRVKVADPYWAEAIQDLEHHMAFCREQGKHGDATRVSET